MEITFTLNGRAVTVNAQPAEILTDVLRQRLGVTSVKKGCESGDCGACAVLLDGQLVNSCLTLTATVSGHSITTVEGLMEDGELDIVQTRLAEYHGTQCGYCTPGMVLAIKALLNQNPRPGEMEIREALAGNLCRCTGYQKIVTAVQSITV